MEEVCVESFYKEKLLLKKKSFLNYLPQKVLAFWAGDVAHW